jgi:hypothetical protein
VLVLLPLDVRLLAPMSVLRVAVPWLHGPVHDWLVIPGWLHEQMHAEGVRAPAPPGRHNAASPFPIRRRRSALGHF